MVQYRLSSFVAMCARFRVGEQGLFKFSHEHGAISEEQKRICNQAMIDRSMDDSPFCCKANDLWPLCTARINSRQSNWTRLMPKSSSMQLHTHEGEHHGDYDNTPVTITKATYLFVFCAALNSCNRAWLIIAVTCFLRTHCRTYDAKNWFSFEFSLSPRSRLRHWSLHRSQLSHPRGSGSIT